LFRGAFWDCHGHEHCSAICWRKDMSYTGNWSGFVLSCHLLVRYDFFIFPMEFSRGRRAQPQNSFLLQQERGNTNKQFPHTMQLEHSLTPTKETMALTPQPIFIKMNVRRKDSQSHPSPSEKTETQRMSPPPPVLPPTTNKAHHTSQYDPPSDSNTAPRTHTATRSDSPPSPCTPRHRRPAPPTSAPRSW
jgi:hypothetical protein